MATAAVILIAYAIGSVPFAVIVSRALGLPDPRSYGSGNPGTTNVLRTGKKLAALLTLAGDGGKGWLAVFLAGRYAVDFGVGDAGIAACAVAVVLGHMYPVFLASKAARGWPPREACSSRSTFRSDRRAGHLIVLALLFRYASLASVVAAACAPVCAYFVKLPMDIVWALVLIAALIVWRHRGNLRNLVMGKDRRIGEKEAAGPDARGSTGLEKN
jgi:glycerol-3-phosphate acyltransferase PlsY